MSGETDEAGASHFLVDAQGSPVALADATGAIQSSYTYNPFGTTTANGTANTNTYQFTGRENDATGLYYYRARYYAPGLQRFVSEDPIDFLAGDSNLYAYVGNSPADAVDPSGLYAGYDDAAFIIGGAAAGLIGQGVGDLIAGRRSCWTDYVGAAFGGAVSGGALLYGGPVAAGALGGLAANGMTQFLNNQWGYQSGYDAADLAFNTGMGALLGKFGKGLRMPVDE